MNQMSQFFVGQDFFAQLQDFFYHLRFFTKELFNRFFVRMYREQYHLVIQRGWNGLFYRSFEPYHSTYQRSYCSKYRLLRLLPSVAGSGPILRLYGFNKSFASEPITPHSHFKALPSSITSIFGSHHYIR